MNPSALEERLVQLRAKVGALPLGKEPANILVNVRLASPTPRPVPERPFMTSESAKLKQILNSFVSQYNGVARTLDRFVVVHQGKVIDPAHFSDTLQQLGIVTDTEVVLFFRHFSITPDVLSELLQHKVVSTHTGDFLRLLNDDAFSDVTFVVDGVRVPAHKCVLATRCEKFRAMFLGTFREGSQKEIVIEEYSHSVFCAMLEFVYTDLITRDVEQPADLLCIAEEYLLPRLKYLCEEKLIMGLDVFNVSSLLILSDIYNCVLLKKYCIEFIKSSLDFLSCMADFDAELEKVPHLKMQIMKMKTKTKKRAALQVE